MSTLIAYLAALATSAHAADCASPVPPDRLAEHLDAAEAGYAGLDVTAFQDALDTAVFAVPCLDAVVSPELAARYHALVGIRLLTERLEEDATRAFAAAKRASPSYRVPLELLPQGHEGRDLFDQATSLGVRGEIPRPRDATVWFDGAEAPDRPLDHPSLVQVTASDGAVTASRWVRPDDALPAYDALPPTPGGATAAPTAQRRRLDGVDFALIGSAVGAAAGAAALYIAAANTNNTFQRPLPSDQGQDELLSLRRRTNLLVGASVGAGAVAVAAGVTLGVRR